MSDAPQGPGWWQASDGKYYPPEQAPGAQPAQPGQPAGPSPQGQPTAKLDVGAALSYGWTKFTEHLGQILVIVVIIVAVNIVFRVIGNAISGSVDNFVIGFTLSMLFLVAGLFVSFVLQAGVIRAGLAITRGQAPDPSMLFQTTNIGPYIVASILVSAAIFVGFFFFCIGALIVGLFTYFYGFYCIDRGMEPVDSIKANVEVVKNNAGDVLLFALVATLLNVITCGLAIGVTYIAGAYVYRTLNGEPVA